MSGRGARIGMGVLAAALALAPAACGKRGAIVPPEGQESQYTYPRQYPDPATVRPQTEDEEAPRSREVQPRATKISPFPSTRETTTYGSGAE